MEQGPRKSLNQKDLFLKKKKTFGKSVRFISEGEKDWKV